jgi:type VI secretion system protein ImpH
MAAARGGTSAPVNAERSVEERLFEEGAAFDFFQAVRLLERWSPARQPVGRNGPLAAEIVRFGAHLSLSFPASRGIFEIQRPATPNSAALMAVTFMGLTGPRGELPDHYTELLLRLERDGKGPERRALRDWLDLFNHRFLSLFYRAWEKYRFWRGYERGEHDRTEPDPFTRALFSFVGVEPLPLRRRLRVSCRVDDAGDRAEKVLARIDDLALLHYGGFLAQRVRCALSLQVLLEDYFQIAVRIEQFRGRWLSLDVSSQSRMGAIRGNNGLGLDIVAGERVWEVQGKFRVRLGPLRYADFVQFIPDRKLIPQRKAFFLLVHLVRLYAGPEFDFDVQLVLRKEDVPACQLTDKDGLGPRLGWNTWVRGQPAARDADDAAFAGEEIVFLDSN